MIVVHLLMQCLWAADQAGEIETQQKPTAAELCEDIEENQKQIKAAEENKERKVFLTRPMPTIKQIYNASELRKFLAREKESQGHNSQINDDIAKECHICSVPFFLDRYANNLFKKRVYKTHEYLPICVMCPKPHCNSGRLCCNCTRDLINNYTKTKAPIEYYDNKKNPISNQKMAPCYLCSTYFNIELSELDHIPEKAKSDNKETLKYIEDLVYYKDKTHWLLETTVSSNAYSYVLFFEMIKKLSSGIITLDASEKLLVDDLSRQSNFYRACTHSYKYFAIQVHDIKTFIENCTEKVNYPFMTHLARKFALSNQTPDMLEEHFKDICSSVPIEHADRFSVIYYAMIIGYFEKTKDNNMNLQFIKRWILSKYSFILTGFKHQNQIYDQSLEAKYYPLVADFYTAFIDALHDIRLIDNIIHYNALEFTFKGLCYYPRNSAQYYQDLITNIMERYFKKLKEENNYGMYKDIFVNRHGADVRRFSYPAYKNILTDGLGHEINSTPFNEPNSANYMVGSPAFIYDAILKVFFTMAPEHFDYFTRKITHFFIQYSDQYANEKNYADFLRETYKAKSYADAVVRTSIRECFTDNDVPNAVLLFKNLPTSLAVEDAIELFNERNLLPELIEGINKYEFVNWENETAIYKLLKDQNKLSSLPALLVGMSKQPSCFFEATSDEIDYLLINMWPKKYKDYRRIGSLAFVCRNEKLLEAFRDDLDGILTNWDFALNLHKFYNGVISPEGTTNISDLPFFKMYYAELFQWLDKNISSDDKALKISRMLMVAKLALRDLTVKMEVDPIETGDASINMDSSSSSASIFALEKEIIKAVGNTTVGYEAFCAFQCFLSAAFKKHLEEEIFPDIVAIEGEDKAGLLKEWELRGYYRKIFRLQEGLNIKQTMISCSEEEMREFLEMLSALQQIDKFSALKGIKSKNEIEGKMTDIKYYTDNIAVLPIHAYGFILRSL
ncbi:hypothetical protein ENBRE01_1560 [Enteropsectra breve]|nr:hypothetical protein ENBRE01_1560 [Enteropsectra breve]